MNGFIFIDDHCPFNQIYFGYVHGYFEDGPAQFGLFGHVVRQHVSGLGINEPGIIRYFMRGRNMSAGK